MRWSEGVLISPVWCERGSAFTFLFFLCLTSNLCVAWLRRSWCCHDSLDQLRICARWHNIMNVCWLCEPSKGAAAVSWKSPSSTFLCTLFPIHKSEYFCPMLLYQEFQDSIWPCSNNDVLVLHYRHYHENQYSLCIPCCVCSLIPAWREKIEHLWWYNII